VYQWEYHLRVGFLRLVEKSRRPTAADPPGLPLERSTMRQSKRRRPPQASPSCGFENQTTESEPSRTLADHADRKRSREHSRRGHMFVPRNKVKKSWIATAVRPPTPSVSLKCWQTPNAVADKRHKPAALPNPTTNLTPIRRTGAQKGQTESKPAAEYIAIRCPQPQALAARQVSPCAVSCLQVLRPRYRGDERSSV